MHAQEFIFHQLLPHSVQMTDVMISSCSLNFAWAKNRAPGLDALFLSF